MNYRYSTLDPYEMRHLAMHLAEGGMRKALAALLTDHEFLDTKLLWAEVADLLDDFQLAEKAAADDEALVLFFRSMAEVVTRHADFLSRHRNSLFQVAWNLLRWSPSGTHEGHYAVAPRMKLAASVGDHDLLDWLDRWRVHKEADPAFLWVRQERPALHPLGESVALELRGLRSACFLARYACDGRSIAAASVQFGGSEPIPASFRTWDSTSGASGWHLDFDANITDFAIFPARNLIAIGCSDGQVTLLDSVSRSPVVSYLVDDAGVRSMCLDPGVARLLVGCYMGRSCVVDALGGQLIRDLPGHDTTVAHLAWSRRGTIFTADKRVRIWDADTGNLSKALPVQEQAITAMAIHPDGVLCATACGDPEKLMLKESTSDTAISIWDVYAGTVVMRLEGHPEPVQCLAFSADGRQLASSGGSAIEGDRDIRIWDLASGAEYGRISGSTQAVTSLEFSTDGRSLLVSTFDGAVRVWNVYAALAKSALVDHSGEVFGLVFSPDGGLVASSAFSDSDIFLWDVRSGMRRRVLSGHASLIRAFKFSENGGYLVSGAGSNYRGVDCSVRVWEVATGRELRSFLPEVPDRGERHGHVNPVKAVGFGSARGRPVVFAGHADLQSFAQSINLVRCWDLGSGELISTEPGDESTVRRRSETALDRLQTKALEQEFASGKQASNRNSNLAAELRTVAGWAGDNRFTLLARDDETAVRRYGQEVAWIPESIHYIVAPSPAGPAWAAGQGSHLMMFSLQGQASGSVTPGR